MYYFRSSLTGLLNLLCVCPVVEKVVLLGVDLNSPYFFQEELDRQESLHDMTTARMNTSEPTHPTEQPSRFQGGLTSQWPQIAKWAAEAGVQFVCGTPGSLLVEKGLTNYEPIPTSSQTREGTNLDG